MPVQPVKTFLLAIPKEQLDTWLNTLIYSDIQFEPLSPLELPGNWQHVRFGQHQAFKFSTELALLEKVLAYYQPTGLLANLTDTRLVASWSEVNQAKDSLENTLQLAQLVDQYQQLQRLTKQIQKLIKQFKLPISHLFVGQNLEQFEAELHDFVESTITTFSQRHSQEPPLTIQKPACKLFSVGDYQILVVEGESGLEVVKTFLQTSQWGQKVETLTSFIQAIQNQLGDLKADLITKNFDPDNPNEDSLKQLAIAHANLQLQKLVSECSQKVFQIADNAKILFLFVALVKDEEAKLKSLVQTHNQVLAQEFEWPVQIVNWQNSGDLASFQTIGQAMGTISPKETDPTLITAILFSLFFAFCLSDALYGLVIALATGFLLFFRKPKPQLKNILTIFFWSGVATVVYGALTNSWAGNLFQKTPIGPILANLQILDPLSLNPMQANPELGLERNPVLNQWLIDAGNIHPIAALLGLTLMIGMISLFIGYFIKLNNDRKAKNWASLAFDISWVGFLISLFVYIYSLVSAQFSSQITLVIMSLFTIALFIFNEGKNLIGKIVKGLGSLYGLISFGSDVLSFTRLVAVGLTSSIIANVINQLGFLLYQSVNHQILGAILLVGFLLVGHLFNLVIALFGAYINPLRLSYVEFYPKFFKGQARQIQPLQKNSFYLNYLINN